MGDRGRGSREVKDTGSSMRCQKVLIPQRLALQTGVLGRLIFVTENVPASSRRPRAIPLRPVTQENVVSQTSVYARPEAWGRGAARSAREPLLERDSPVVATQRSRGRPRRRREGVSFYVLARLVRPSLFPLFTLAPWTFHLLPSPSTSEILRHNDDDVGNPRLPPPSLSRSWPNGDSLRGKRHPRPADA